MKDELNHNAFPRIMVLEKWLCTLKSGSSFDMEDMKSLRDNGLAEATESTVKDFGCLSFELIWSDLFPSINLNHGTDGGLSDCPSRFRLKPAGKSGSGWRGWSIRSWPFYAPIWCFLITSRERTQIIVQVNSGGSIILYVGLLHEVISNMFIITLFCVVFQHLGHLLLSVWNIKGHKNCE